MRSLAQIRTDLLAITEELEAHERTSRSKGFQGVPFFLKGCRQYLVGGLSSLLLAVNQETADKQADKAMAGRAAAARN